MKPRGAASVLCALLPVAASGSCAGERDATGLSAPHWFVDSIPSVAIGGPDERLEYIVYGVAGASRLSDGRIVVASQAASQVKYFDQQGNHLRTVGGAGRGPGEFEAILAAFRLPRDTLLVVSREPGLTWLAPNGDYVRSLRVSIWGLERHRCRISESAFHSVGDGRLVTTFDDNLGTPGCPPVGEGPHRVSTLIELQDHQAPSFDTVAILPGTERNGIWYRVFGRLALLTAGSGRVVATDSGSDTIWAWQLDDDQRQAWRAPFRAEQVHFDATRPTSRRYTLGSGRTMLREYSYPDSYPTTGRLLLDGLGNLWVMAYPATEEPLESIDLAQWYSFRVEDDGARWRVLDPRGELVAQVRTPPGLYPIEIGQDYVLGISKDEYDVEAVQLHGLSRR